MASTWFLSHGFYIIQVLSCIESTPHSGLHSIDRNHHSVSCLPDSNLQFPGASGATADNKVRRHKHTKKKAQRSRSWRDACSQICTTASTPRNAADLPPKDFPDHLTPPKHRPHDEVQLSLNKHSLKRGKKGKHLSNLSSTSSTLFDLSSICTIHLFFTFTVLDRLFLTFRSIVLK